MLGEAVAQGGGTMSMPTDTLGDNLRVRTMDKIFNASIPDAMRPNPRLMAKTQKLSREIDEMKELVAEKILEFQEDIQVYHNRKELGLTELTEMRLSELLEVFASVVQRAEERYGVGDMGWL